MYSKSCYKSVIKTAQIECGNVLIRIACGNGTVADHTHDLYA